MHLQYSTFETSNVEKMNRSTVCDCVTQALLRVCACLSVSTRALQAIAGWLNYPAVCWGLGGLHWQPIWGCRVWQVGVIGGGVKKTARMKSSPERSLIGSDCFLFMLHSQDSRFTLHTHIEMQQNSYAEKIIITHYSVCLVSLLGLRK